MLSDISVPAAPTMISPVQNSVIADQTPRLEWSAVTNAEYYEVSLTSLAGSIYSDFQIDSTELTTPSLVNATYAWDVKACNETGCSPRAQSGFTVEFSSDGVGVSTLISPKNEEEIDDTTPMLEWSTQATNVSYFKLNLASPNSRVLDDQIVAASGPGNYTFTTPILAPDGYAWTIENCTNDGCSAEVGQVFFVIEGNLSVDPPNSPQNLSPSNEITNDISPPLRWDVVDGADYYMVNLSSSDGIIFDKRQFTANNISTPDLGEGLYNWSVAACNDGGCSAPSLSMFTVEEVLGTLVINMLDGETNRAISNYNLKLKDFSSGDIVFDNVILEQTTEVNLPLGTYEVFVTKPGYLPLSDEFCQATLLQSEQLCQFEVSIDPSGQNFETNLISSGFTQAANGASRTPVVSDNGKVIVYQSDASNITEDDTNSVSDMFVYDAVNDTTRRLNLPVITGGFAISGDGNYLAFSSTSSTVVANDNNGVADIFVINLQSGLVERIESGQVESNGGSVSPSISTDGRHVSFISSASNLVENDTNETSDTFVFDRDTQTLERVSISNSGSETNKSSRTQSISGDGRYVAFSTFASNLIPTASEVQENLFLFERETKTLTHVSKSLIGLSGNGRSNYPKLSNNGRFISYLSSSSNLIVGDENNAYDVFVYDRVADTQALISTSSFGVKSDRYSQDPSISGDGRYITFTTDSSLIDELSAGGDRHVYLKDRWTNVTTRVSVGFSGGRGDASSSGGIVSGDGTAVVFQSSASNLVETDTNNVSDVFLSAR